MESISANACRSASNRAMTFLGVHSRLDHFQGDLAADRRCVLFGHKRPRPNRLRPFAAIVCNGRFDHPAFRAPADFCVCFGPGLHWEILQENHRSDRVPYARLQPRDAVAHRRHKRVPGTRGRAREPGTPAGFGEYRQFVISGTVHFSLREVLLRRSHFYQRHIRDCYRTAVGQ